MHIALFAVMLMNIALAIWPCPHQIFEIYVCHVFFIRVSYINGVCNWVTGDKLIGEVSRIVVAEACIQALDIEFTEGEIYEINSVEVTYKR